MRNGGGGEEEMTDFYKRSAGIELVEYIEFISS